MAKILELPKPEPVGWADFPPYTGDLNAPNRWPLQPLDFGIEPDGAA